MNVTTSTTPPATVILLPELPCGLDSPGPNQLPTVLVWLKNIIIERGRLFVYITDGRHNHTLEPKAQVLTSFPRFQQYLLDKLNVLVSHRSQDAPSSRRRRRELGAALQVAFDRGCVN